MGGDTTITEALNNIITIKDEPSEVITTNNWYLNPFIDTAAMESVKAWQSA